jgi:hypothetical protein
VGSSATVSRSAGEAPRRCAAVPSHHFFAACFGKIGEVPPPPILLKTGAMTVRLLRDHVVVVPEAGARPLGYQQSLTKEQLVELWIRTANMFDVAIEPAGGGLALLRIHGAFHEAATSEAEARCARWVGPLPLPEITALHDKLIATFGLPPPVVPVTEADLVANPSAFHQRWVEVIAAWSYHFEHSVVAQLWFSPIDGLSSGQQAGTWWRIIGRVHCILDGPFGYGHRGMWVGSLQAVSMTPVPPP